MINLTNHMPRKRKYLTSDEVLKLLNASKIGKYASRDECLIKVCFTHGFRVSELSALTLSDINLEDRIIHVNRLKNGFSTTHPLLEEEVGLLKKWLADRGYLKGADSEWLFLSQKGGPLSRQQLYNIFQKHGKNAGIPVLLTPHMLRHSCGFALADNGADTRLIQDYLGHKNIQHTVLYTASNAARFRGVWEEKKR